MVMHSNDDESEPREHTAPVVSHLIYSEDLYNAVI